MKLLRNLLLVVLVPVLIGAGVVFFLSHKNVVAKATAEYGDFAPASARFSRFRVTKDDSLSIFWKMHFEKPGKQTPSVGVWHMQPFGKVTFEGGKR
jgi:hypothetical protein